MSRETIAFVLGRAALDEEYLVRLMKDPVAAAQEMKLTLSPDDETLLTGLDFKGLEVIHAALIVKCQKPPTPIFYLYSHFSSST